MLSPSLVILNPTCVILNKVKDLNSMLRINFAKHLPVAQCRLREESRPFTEPALSVELRSFAEFTRSHELDPSLPLRMTAEGLRMTREGLTMTSEGFRVTR